METPTQHQVAPRCATFVLPEIDNRVPSLLGSTASENKLLARFALAAEEIGFDLPGVLYESPREVVIAQIRQWMASHLSNETQELLPATARLLVDECRLLFCMEAHNSLVTIRLKPVIEALEEIESGLGWFVEKTISRTSAHGINLYSTYLLGYEAEGRFFGEIDDLAFVKAAYFDGRGEEPDSQKLDELMAEAREEFAYLPSDILRSVDGHGHLLGWNSGPRTIRALGPQEAQHSLANPLISAELKECVRDAIELQRLLDADAQRVLGWNGDDELESLGAAAFVAWDDPTFLIEAVEHYEQSLYESGNAVEWLARLEIEATASDQELKDFACKLRDYFNRWNALGNLLKHFPQENIYGN